MHILSRFALALVAALFISATAYAEGIAKGKVAAAAVQEPAGLWAPSWTGFYAGISGEYTMQTTEAFGGLLNFDANDISYGVAVGYDHKLAGTTIVIGVMGDMMWQRNESVVASFDRSWFIGARAGLLFSPTVLVYALAGHSNLSGDFAMPSLDSGLTLGAGIEAYMTKNLRLKVEWRRTDLGDAGTGMGAFSSTQDGLRLGLSYAFDSGSLFGQ